MFPYSQLGGWLTTIYWYVVQYAAWCSVIVKWAKDCYLLPLKEMCKWANGSGLSPGKYILFHACLVLILFEISSLNKANTTSLNTAFQSEHINISQLNVPAFRNDPTHPDHLREGSTSGLPSVVGCFSNNSWAMKKALVICCIEGIILPNYTKPLQGSRH